MSVQAISTTDKRKRPIINAKTTGYAATLGMGLSVASGFSRNKQIRIGHKVFAGFSVVALAAHLYTIHMARKNFKKASQETSNKV